MNKPQFAKSIFTFSLALVFFSCVEVPTFSEVPEISNARIAKFVVNNAQFGLLDSLRISFDFKDGDGNIGDSIVGNNDFTLLKENIIGGDTVLDNNSKPTVKFKYAFDPKLKNSPISGTVTFYYSEAQALNPRANDTTRYSIQIMDRKRNLSNKIYTSFIVLNER
ncbi:MAG: hypothetical protein KA313_08925 [Pseudarcicella sp.]|nr:hypothetical protein [Pseudarcicella sp.]